MMEDVWMLFLQTTQDMYELYWTCCSWPSNKGLHPSFEMKDFYENILLHRCFWSLPLTKYFSLQTLTMLEEKTNINNIYSLPSCIWLEPYHVLVFPSRVSFKKLNSDWGNKSVNFKKESQHNWIFFTVPRHIARSYSLPWKCTWLWHFSE